MRLSVTTRRFIISMLSTLTLFCLIAAVGQINYSARCAMDENAVPALAGSGNGIIESVFEGSGLSALRSVIAKIFPYTAVVLEFLIYVFFAIVGTRL